MNLAHELVQHLLLKKAELVSDGNTGNLQGGTWLNASFSRRTVNVRGNHLRLHGHPQERCGFMIIQEPGGLSNSADYHRDHDERRRSASPAR